MSLVSFLMFDVLSLRSDSAADCGLLSVYDCCLEGGFGVQEGPLLLSVSEAPLSRPLLASDWLGTFACEKMRVRRFVIVAFLATTDASCVGAGTWKPLGLTTGSSGMEGWGSPGLPSCECKVDVELEGDGVGGGR